MNWEPIETAPKDGTIVQLRDEGGVFHCVMHWNGARWEGMAFGPLGSSKTFWDESFIKPYEWKPLAEPRQ